MHERLVIGLQGERLNEDERRWLAAMPPRGVILFARNLQSPGQVRELLAEVRDLAGLDCWAAIDEEGGRVHRLPWAPFNARGERAEYGRIHVHDPETAAREVYRDSLEAGEALRELGLTHNCAPVLDVFHPQGHAIIGERAYSHDPDVVAWLGLACMRGLKDAGITAVGKHFPGHGRADADSHVDVPHVDAPLEVLLAEAEPFARLIGEGLEHLMTAHVIYDAVAPEVATLSGFWIGKVLRRRFGFRGTVWSDDLCMRGVGEDVVQAARRAEAAGCDILLVCQPEGVRQVYAVLAGETRPEEGEAG